MSITVPLRRAYVRTEELRNGLPVRSQHGQSFARAVNYLLGHGRCVVPAHPVHRPQAIVDATEQVFRYWSVTSPMHFDLLWNIELRLSGSTGGGTVGVRAPAGTGATVETGVPATRGGGTLGIAYLQRRASYGTGADGEELTLGVRGVDIGQSETGVEVGIVSCFEVPRVDLDAPAVGIDHALVRTEDPILVDGIGDLDLLRDSRRSERGAYINVAADSGDSYIVETSSTSFVNAFLLPHQLMVPPRTSETTRRPRLRYHAAVGGGAIEVRAVAGVGGGSQVLLSSADGWSGILACPPMQCVDLDQPDVLLGAGGWDTLTVQVRSVNGNPVRLHSVSVHDRGA